MIKNCVATLNIGSKDITLSVGERGVNGAFSFKAVEKVDYYPYFEGEFYDVKELESKIAFLFDSLIQNSDISKISTVFVGVPGEFSKVVSKNYRITFSKVKTITAGDVKYLYNTAYDDDDAEYTLVHQSAVYFVADNYKTHEPIGKKASSLSARISYGLVINHFLEVMGNILTKIGVTKIKYILQSYADAMYLFTIQERDLVKMLIDIGYSTSTLSIVCGNGLLYSSSFALGGGMVSAYLSSGLGCDYEIADILKEKLNLGLKERESAYYVVSDDGIGDFTFSRNMANKIAKDLLDGIAENLDKAVHGCTLKVPSDIENCFTGEGISSVKGDVEYISTRLGVFPKIVCPKIPHYNKPKHTSRLSLLDTALAVINDKLFFIDK